MEVGGAYGVISLTAELLAQIDLGVGVTVCSYVYTKDPARLQ